MLDLRATEEKAMAEEVAKADAQVESISYLGSLVWALGAIALVIALAGAYKLWQVSEKDTVESKLYEMSVLDARDFGIKAQASKEYNSAIERLQDREKARQAMLMPSALETSSLSETWTTKN